MAVANLIKRLVQLELLDPKNVDNARQVKSATTRYENIKKENSVFAKREKLAEKNNFDTVMDAEEFPKNIVTPEDLQGEILIPLMGDPSDIGLLSQVGGIPVRSNVQGGSKFPFKWDDLAWASQSGSAENYVNKVRHVEDTFGQAPISVNTLMTDSSMYSPKFVRNAVFQQLENSPKLLKKDVLEFDERVRNDKQVDLSDWPGLFNGGIEMLDNLSMIKRGKVLEIMAMPKFRNKGFPVVKETINAARDPRFAGSSLGDSGAAIVRVDPSRDVIPLPDRIHENYDAGILKAPGSTVQQFERLIPYRKSFKDLFAEKAVAVDKNGRPLNYQNIIHSGNLSKEGIQRADQEWVDANMAYLEKMKGRPEGLLGAVGMTMSPQGDASLQQKPTSDISQTYQGDPMTGMDLSQVKGTGVPFSQAPGTLGEIGKSIMRGIPLGVLDTFDALKDLGTSMGFIPDNSAYIPKEASDKSKQMIRDTIPDFKPRYLDTTEKEFAEFIGGLLGPI